MSIIQKIRDKAAILLTTMISISLIGFLVQDAFIGKSGNMFEGQETEAGTINGKKIDLLEFNKKVNQMEQGYRAQGMTSTDAMTQNIIEGVWNNYIQEQILKVEAEKLNLSVTPKELGAVLFSEDAPQEFKQMFQNKNTGAYDVSAAQTWFNNLKKNAKPEDVAGVIDQLIKPIELGLLAEKYNSLLTQGSYVPTWMLAKMQAENTSFSSIKFLAIPYSSVPDSAVKISDQEINDFINKNKDDYKQEHVKSIAFVSFSANPTTEDTLKVYNKVLEQKAAFENSDDARAFVTKNTSSVPYFDGYVQKSKLKMGAKDLIIGMPVGVVVGPYLDGSNYVLAKKLEKKSIPDSVKFRHILISVVDPQTGKPRRADSTAKKTADSIYAAIRAGGSFGALAATLSEDEGSKAKGGEYNFASMDMASLPKEFADFIFNKPQGSMGVVKTSLGYQVTEVMSQKNFDESYKVAYFAKPIIASDETDASASSAALQFAAISKDVKSFNAASEKMKLDKKVVDNIKELDYSVASLSSRAIVKWVFDNKVGTISEPFDLKNQYVVVVVTNELKEGLQTPASVRIVVEPTLRNKKKADILARKAGAETNLEKLATIVGGSIGQADTVKFFDPFVPNLGAEPKVIGAAFNKNNISKTSQIIDGQNGIYYISVNQIGALPSASFHFATEKKMFETQMKQYANYSTLESLKKATKIVDNRRAAGY
jgi:peptidyl-prolyl cis-trans isomerase D